ncbi:BQ5605_C007g04688 [Microbotryum silenes-dioicae]|uniref:BQ5605_C007g04688 protein n=1 Tax=Microbotryum silenes-dioicae TaxID=796604 RepID=A0A2X0P3A3_9BASI|nr:BQ5605_C007g04688 [Microbotryum silenes-dioicae]
MSQQNLLRGFPLVSTAGSLLGPSRLVEASALIENALSYSQRYKRRHTTANSTLRVVNGGITTTSVRHDGSGKAAAFPLKM